MNDTELALRARDGEREAFGLLLERHYDLVYRLARRYTGNAADAEDIAQEVCVGLAGKLRSFRGEARFSTWLYRVVVNACHDHRRRQVALHSLGAAFVEVAALTAADRADSAGRSRWLHEALASLDEALRETALLVVGEDLSHAEAGDILGVKEATVSWRMHQVRKKLSALKGSDDER